MTINSTNTDINLKVTADGYHDITWDVNGDYTKTAGFDTAIQMSFMCERRADESEVSQPQRRRGWWGNEINGFDNFEYGSKLWLLEQARKTVETLNNSIKYSQDCTQWFIDEDKVDTINVTAFYNDELDLIIKVDFIRNNNVIFTRAYNLWENTFKDGDI